MNRTGIAAALTISAILPVVPAAFELPSPTGPYAVGTTAWRVTDRSRRETFTGSGEFRQVEVLAWYPAAAPRRGVLAP